MTIRILVTGFSVFPGAPINPSEDLIARFRDEAAQCLPDVAISAVVFETAYASIGMAFADALEASRPDAAVHFGLAKSARGFRLETTARNEIRPGAIDARGDPPPGEKICDGPDLEPSGLPLDEIEARLRRLGLPVERSDDTGGYLCNYLFYLARRPSGRIGAPLISGFIHIPHLAEHADLIPEGGTMLTRDALWRGSLEIVAATADAVKERLRIAPHG